MNALRFAAPSLVAAVLAAAIAGAIEGARHAGALPAVVGIGHAMAFVVPLLLLIAAGGRALWRAWQPAWAPRGDESPAIAGARVAGGLGYAAVAVAALAAAGYAGARTGASITRVPAIAALITAGVVGAAAVVVLAMARPMARAVAAAVEPLAWVTPRRVAAVALAAVAGLAVAVWAVAIRPTLATVDLGVTPYAVPLIAVAIAVHVVWTRWPRARWPLGAAAFAAGVGIAGVTAWTRAARPVAVIEAWQALPIGGLAIERSVDIHQLARALRPDELAPAATRDRHPDIVLVTIDTVRADRLALLGGPVALPNLERFAAGAAIFERAYAPSNATRRSIPAIASGVSAPRLRGRVVGWALKLDPRHTLLAERLAAAGYDTAGFFCCAKIFAGPDDVGLDRGLDTVGFKRDAPGLTRLAARWLDRPGDAPRFLWVHYYEPHVWGATYPDPDEPAPARYDRSLRDLDRSLDDLFEAIDATGRDVIVAVTSDHGEGLGDHKQMHHNSDLYDAQLRVPLLVRAPDVPARRIAAATGLVDLAPTLLELAGFAPPGMPEMDGVSLVPVLTAASPPGPETGEAFAAMIVDRSVPTGVRALVAGRHKLIVVDGRAPQLYDLDADPGELHDLAASQPTRVAELRARLDARTITAPPF